MILFEIIVNNISWSGWLILLFSAVLIGLSKTGVSAAGMLAMPLMALSFGGKLSTGIVLPMLCMADVLAVSYYHRHADWSHVLKLLPPAIAGILIGTFTGNNISDAAFKDIMGIIIILSVIILVWRDFKKDIGIPKGYLYPFLMGLCGGFTTMVGNAAGVIMALYLLSMHLPKNIYIGTGAWFFFIVNLFKVPFQIFIWHNIDMKIFMLDLSMFPMIVAGGLAGIYIIKHFPEKAYRIFLIITTALSALIIIIR
jgi:uncharacterized protein